jgi:hypothetical protein
LLAKQPWSSTRRSERRPRGLPRRPESFAFSWRRLLSVRRRVGMCRVLFYPEKGPTASRGQPAVRGDGPDSNRARAALPRGASAKVPQRFGPCAAAASVTGRMRPVHDPTIARGRRCPGSESNAHSKCGITSPRAATDLASVPNVCETQSSFGRRRRFRPEKRSGGPPLLREEHFTYLPSTSPPIPVLYPAMARSSPVRGCASHAGRTDEDARRPPP